MREPKIIPGGIAIDDRGSASFVNDFGFEGIKRFYMLKNHKQGFIRAWHGHKLEKKFMYVPRGSALICCVEIDDWDNPSKDLKVHRFVLSEHKPSILYIPEGYANGFMSLTEDAELMVFSTTTLDVAMTDDIRFPAHYWDPWEIVER